MNGNGNGEFQFPPEVAEAFKRAISFVQEHQGQPTNALADVVLAVAFLREETPLEVLSHLVYARGMLEIHDNWNDRIFPELENIFGDCR